MLRTVRSSDRILRLEFEGPAIPPAPNDWPKHHMAEHRAKNKYRAYAWAQAVQQVKPPRDPWEKVIVNARFHLWTLRDELDGLPGSLKWLLDALKQKQSGSDASVRHWRNGLAVECGYFIDDHPKYARTGKVSQVINRARQYLEIAIVRAG